MAAFFTTRAHRHIVRPRTEFKWAWYVGGARERARVHASHEVMRFYLKLCNYCVSYLKQRCIRSSHDLWSSRHIQTRLVKRL